MLESLKEEVLKANQNLVKYNLVLFTWGNVSGINREKQMVVIKPSGVSYDIMKLEDMIVVDMNGNVIEGKLKPSSDLKTHLELYKAFENIGGIVHTHSEWATCWAQAGKDIPAYGTTHADYFYGNIPCTRKLTQTEIESDYEKETGNIIIERFKNLSYQSIPGVIVNGHAPFTWGKFPNEAIHNAVVLEEIAKMAYRTENMGNTFPVDQFLLDKHYNRKHGENAYYGQQ